MANDTDLLTSSESNVSSNGEIERRQATVLSVDMSSGAHNVEPVGRSAEKLDACVANGCVTLHEGTFDVTQSVVCSNNNATATCNDEDVLKLAQNAVCVDNQHPTANGLVSPTIDKHSNQLTVSADVRSQQSIESSQQCLPAAGDHESTEFSAETAQKVDFNDSNQQLAVDESSCCACSLPQTELTADLSKLSIIDESSEYPIVPCDESVVTQSNTKASTVKYNMYESETQMESIMKLITKDLSEPYSIYTYRYFIHNWPKLCFLVSI